MAERFDKTVKFLHQIRDVVAWVKKQKADGISLTPDSF